MKNLIIFLAFIGSLLFLDSCKLDACINKTYFTSTYNSFMKDMQKNHETYSEADWKSKDEKVESYVNDCYPQLSMSMTGDEKINFWTKYVKYMFLRHGNKALKEIENQDKTSEVQIYEEILDSLEEGDLEKMFKDMYGDDIEKAVDDVLNEINKWGDQLKDWLNRRSE